MSAVLSLVPSPGDLARTPDTQWPPLMRIEALADAYHMLAEPQGLFAIYRAENDIARHLKGADSRFTRYVRVQREWWVYWSQEGA